MCAVKGGCGGGGADSTDIAFLCFKSVLLGASVYLYPLIRAEDPPPPPRDLPPVS